MNKKIESEFWDLLSSESITELLAGNIMITGSTGNLMSYFLEFLTFCQDQKIKIGQIYAVSYSGLFPNSVRLPKGVKVICGDLADHDFVASLPNCRFLIHAGGYAQPSKFGMNPIKTYLINSSTTFQLSHKVQDGGSMLFLSSSEIYSGLTSMFHHELQVGQSSPSHPRACYIEGKIGGETIIEILRQEGRIKPKSARVSLVYGPGFRSGDRRVLNSMIESAITTKEIRLIDQGHAFRTYCYISDAMKQLMGIVVKGGDSVYNVGGDSQTTIRDLALLVGTLTDSSVFFSDDVGDQSAPNQVSLDLTRIRELLGGIDFISLEEGLDRTINWFTSELKSS
jgi:nucleoside-diphosphate-sugar epimerase